MIYSKRLLFEHDFPLIADALKKEREPVLVKGMTDSLIPFFLKELAFSLKRRCVIVLPDEKKAQSLYQSLFSSDENLIFCPARENELVNFDSAAHDITNQRLFAIEHFADGDFSMAFTSLEALLQETVPKKDFCENRICLKIGDEIELPKTVLSLVSAGYSRCERVEGKGQFALRGDILDVFPPSNDYPVRIEFFGDSVDAMGIFDISSQRRIENVTEIKIPPATEIFFSKEKKEAMAQFLSDEISASKDAEYISYLAETKERIISDRLFARDMFLSLNYKKETLLDYLDNDTVFIIFDEKELENEIKGAKAILSETLITLAEKKRLISGKNENALIEDFSYFADILKKRSTVIIDSFTAGRKKIAPHGIYSFNSRSCLSSFSKLKMLEADVLLSLDDGYITCISVPNTLVGENTVSHFTSIGKKCVLISQESDVTLGTDTVYVVYPEKNSVLLSSGFELFDSKFRVFCDANITGKSKSVRKRAKKDPYREKITSFADLENGDYVVHINHGIGKFCGITKLRSADGVIKDFVKIQYSGSDVLYVPSSNLDSVSKYIGPKSDSANLKLSKMGGSEWKKTTSKAKKSAKDIAKKLIDLYARRMKLEGFKFSRDTQWQREFEDAFPYGETQSQLIAANEIKRDMEKSYPMDRLLCGDVGFGKTEVALRGVFKCIMDNMQAAILVPTTILAWQHYQTVLSRFKGYPVKAEMLSRFRTKKEQEKIIEKLKTGEIDIIIGTHRLLQKDIEFKKLGFLVVDEEQRFGVTHKERLKEISQGVDVLTLTATPIPRTLNMALGGIRDMSVLEEAPEDRFPVQTFVLEYDTAVIFEAIKRELRRGGQVFYLINNIEELNLRAGVIKRAFPDAAIAVAHGNLDRDSLSDIWRDMTDKKIDILLCTTIIETGIDLPDANTLIIENADRFGLSQLHQIRGRVGRSDRKAYAYLTYRGGKELSEISRKRLDAIREYTEFGSGFKIALRDLELRGAGNLLGEEQSGHLDSIGYDLYMKLLSDAVLEEKGEKQKSEVECTVDLPISAYLPENYVVSNSDRLEIYRKIASARSDSDIDDLRDEISDRFGDIPREVENLFRTVKIKWLGEMMRCTKIRYVSKSVVFFFDNADAEVISLLSSVYASRLFISLGTKPYIELTCTKNDSIIDLCEELLTHALEFSLEIHPENN